MADTEIPGARSQAVRIPVLVGGGAKCPEALKGRPHNLGAVPAAAMMKEFFR